MPLFLTGCMRFELNLQVLPGGEGSLDVITRFNPTEANERYRQLRGTDFQGFTPGAESAICGEVFTNPAGVAAIPGASVEQVFSDGWCVERFTVNFAASDNPGQILAGAGIPGWQVQRAGDEWQFDYTYTGAGSRLSEVNLRGLNSAEVNEGLADIPITVNVTMPGSAITNATNADTIAGETLSWTRSVAAPQSFSARYSLTGATTAQPTAVPEAEPTSAPEEQAESTTDDEGEGAGGDEGESAGDDAVDGTEADTGRGTVLTEDEFATGSDDGEPVDASGEVDESAEDSEEIAADAEDAEETVEPSLVTDSDADSETDDDTVPVDDASTVDESSADSEQESVDADDPSTGGVVEINTTNSGPNPWALAALALGAVVFGGGLFYTLRGGGKSERSVSPGVAAEASTPRTTTPLDLRFEDIGHQTPTPGGLMQAEPDPFSVEPSTGPVTGIAPGGHTERQTIEQDPFSGWPAQETPPIATTATTAATTPSIPPVSAPAETRLPSLALPADGPEIAGQIDASSIRWDDERRLWVSDDPAEGTIDFDHKRRGWSMRRS